MTRKLMAILVSSALVFGNVSTSAWSAPDMSNNGQVQTADVAKNQQPLPPAGAAGIKQAQGFVEDYPLLTIALVAGVIALVWILLDEDDDDEAPSTTS
jgi:hypothetical protein